MIKVWIMILVLDSGGSNSKGGLTSISQEFYSLEACQAAMNSIISQTNETYWIKVKSNGCYLNR